MNLSSEKPFEWLNENSRKFLAAGYLGEGLCAEERIANIAKKSRRNSSNARLCRQILLLYV
jgi:ribonucleoside-diphosphate reductase alpha chain